MKGKKLVYGCVIGGFFLTACQKDTPPAPVKQTVVYNSRGVYITNEGNFQSGNASISFYDSKQGILNEDIFKTINNRALGDVCQSMCLTDNKAYIVVNNSGKVEVVNAQDFSSITTITGFTSPRYFLPVSKSKAYVTDFSANKIAIVDLSNHVISGSIPCKGWTEQLALSYGKAFVTNQKSDKLYVINTVTDILTDSISIGYGANSIREDKNGKLWVLCGGDATKNVAASLYRINPLINAVDASFLFPQSKDSPWRLTLNGTSDTLFFLNHGVCIMSITANALPVAPFIAEATHTFYGLGVDPVDHTIYVADPIDYVQKGRIYRYHPKGNLIGDFLVGIIPGDFYFN